jgi:hypothetical protein
LSGDRHGWHLKSSRRRRCGPDPAKAAGRAAGTPWQGGMDTRQWRAPHLNPPGIGGCSPASTRSRLDLPPPLGPGPRRSLQAQDPGRNPPAPGLPRRIAQGQACGAQHGTDLRGGHAALPAASRTVRNCTVLRGDRHKGCLALKGGKAPARFLQTAAPATDLQFQWHGFKHDVRHGDGQLEQGVTKLPVARPASSKATTWSSRARSATTGAASTARPAPPRPLPRPGIGGLGRPPCRIAGR